MLLYCYIATQGRIQDLKLGVAQMDFEKIEKPGGGGGGYGYIKNTIIIVFLYIKLYVKYDTNTFFKYNILYLKPPY